MALIIPTRLSSCNVWASWPQGGGGVIPLRPPGHGISAVYLRPEPDRGSGLTAGTVRWHFMAVPGDAGQAAAGPHGVLVQVLDMDTGSSSNTLMLSVEMADL